MVKNIFIVFALLISTCNKDVKDTACVGKCSQIPEAGPCKAAFKKYYFDRKEKKCKEFTWGGCNGVVPFETLEECQNCKCQ